MNGRIIRQVPFPHILRLAVLILLPALAACGKAPKAIIPKGQIIVLSDSIPGAESADTVRFGRLNSGEIAVKPLLLHNVSQKPLAVISYARTCGCTTFEFDPQPIMPDSLVPARLIFDSRGLEGWQFKLIEVQVAGVAALHKIYIDAEVE